MSEHDHIPGGYVLLSRRLFDGSLADRPPWEFKLWCWMLAKASHAPRRTGQRLDRGQLLTTSREMQAAVQYRVGGRLVRPAKSAIAKFLRRQLEGNSVTTSRTTRGMVITICNYDAYQSPDSYEGNFEDSPKDRRRKPEGYYDRQEGKNVRRKEEEKPPTPLPEPTADPEAPDLSPGAIREAQAVALAATYKKTIAASGDRTCSPNACGPKNIVKLLKDGAEMEDLQAAVRNYAEDIAVLRTDPEFRKHCGNFFGQKKPAYPGYMPGEYERPASPSGSSGRDDYAETSDQLARAYAMPAEGEAGEGAAA